MRQVTIGFKTSGRGAWLAPGPADAYRRMVAAGCPAGGITDAGRTYTEQVALFLERYTTDYRASSKTDRRTWQGRTYWRLPGVASAATPGESRHETGEALDLAEPARSWARAYGTAYGWAHDHVNGEPWHMEYVATLDQHTTTAPTLEDDDMTPEQANTLAHIKAFLEEVPERTRQAVWGTPVSRVEGSPSTALQDAVDGTTAAQSAAAQIGALTAAVQALATREGLDPAQVVAAAREGASQALTGATFTVTTTG